MMYIVVVRLKDGRHIAWSTETDMYDMPEKQREEWAREELAKRRGDGQMLEISRVAQVPADGYPYYVV